ncbi:MAG: hypothetical protein CM1200mP2_55400 [Planctomycetaceae bacterium]|nr:MAG: hypothetical protein CM1200mP2_55400 [Planctomycetaceae bacterium]
MVAELYLVAFSRVPTAGNGLRNRTPGCSTDRGAAIRDLVWAVLTPRNSSSSIDAHRGESRDEADDTPFHDCPGHGLVLVLAVADVVVAAKKSPKVGFLRDVAPVLLRR